MQTHQRVRTINPFAVLYHGCYCKVVDLRAKSIYIIIGFLCKIHSRFCHNNYGIISRMSKQKSEEMSLANFRGEDCLHSPKVMVKRYRRCFSDIARPSMKEKTKENSF